MPLIRLTDPIPVSRYQSTVEVIEQMAPSTGGIIFFWDKSGEFWFAEPKDDIKGHLMSIREDKTHERRQGVEFAFEEWPDPKEREKRWYYVLEHFRPVGQRRNLSSLR